MSSSKRDSYQTPPALFEKLNKIFDFELDLAAEQENAKTLMYCSGPHIDGDDVDCVCGLCFKALTMRIFCNPPYSDLTPWIRAFQRLAGSGNLVVAVLPVDPTTLWWSLMVKGHTPAPSALWFTGKRVNFVHANGCDCNSCLAGKPPNGNNKGTVIAIWTPYAGLDIPTDVQWGFTW